MEKFNKREEQANKAATGKMAANDEKQQRQYQSEQNKLTHSSDPNDDRESLTKQDKNQNSLSVKEKNEEKLKWEQDKDFGIE